MKTAEMKFVVPKGCSVNIEEEMMSDGSRVLIITMDTAEDNTCQLQEGIFKKVPASELSLNDKFLKYTPQTNAEKNFKKMVRRVIRDGVSDFWCPTIAPSFDEEGHIYYSSGMKPAVNKSYIWWKENAKKYAPQRGSKLGTTKQYIAFMAVIIKELVATGWSKADAWNAVCNDSTELGHYSNSSDAKHSLENTGSRSVCGFMDLANTLTIMVDDFIYPFQSMEKYFWMGGGHYNQQGDVHPLVDLGFCPEVHANLEYGCGWIVLDSCPDC